MTNYEWIQQASREDLVKFMQKLMTQDGCYNCVIRDERACSQWGYEKCTDSMLKYLDLEHDPRWIDKYGYTIDEE